MINFLPDLIQLSIVGLYEESSKVVDITSLCEMLTSLITMPVINSPLEEKKRVEKNIIMKSLVKRKYIYRENFQYHSYPGFENFPVTIILSKRRQQLLRNLESIEMAKNFPKSSCASKYDPKIMEDYVYSDENWSPALAHL